MLATTGPGYRGKVGDSEDGYPIYLYEDRSGVLRHVVVLPDDRVVYSDASGKIGYPVDSAFVSATLAGVAGVLLGGPIVGIVSALAGWVMDPVDKLQLH